MALIEADDLEQLLGPNAAGGAASALYSIEAQVGLVTQMILPLMNHGVKSFETKKEVEKEYNIALHNELRESLLNTVALVSLILFVTDKTVWHGGCSSWYLNGGKVSWLFKR